MERREKAVFMNPYVVSMDKFADTMVHLSDRFFSLEGYRRDLDESEYREIFARVTDKVCENCERQRQCLGEGRQEMYETMRVLLSAVEEYGAELNVELKRAFQKKCLFAPRFLREALERYETGKKLLFWNNRMVKNREGYAGQLNRFARLIRRTARDLDAGIFEDEHLEKRLKAHLKKIGVKMISSVFYATADGRYELHLTVRAMKGMCVAVKELAYEVGVCVGRTMIPEQGERPIVGEAYCTIACVEGARYQILHGVAGVGKDCDRISGDTFLVTDLPDGQKVVAISDGMGSGEEALRDSSLVIEMLEELLEAGFSARTAAELMNAALLTGREEVRFSTIDACVFDLYTGKCEFVKSGAAPSFIRSGKSVEEVVCDSLPIGVLRDAKISDEAWQLASGDVVILASDGVLDALPVQEQETLLKGFIRDSGIVNPQELAHYLLGRTLAYSGGKPSDDMTIIVAGIWKL